MTTSTTQTAQYVPVETRMSLFEYINLGTLSTIAVIVKVFPFLRRLSTSSVILCYHSIANSGWRWATRVNDFETHIAYLEKYIVPIEELTKDVPAKGFAISFDDGYADLYTNAFPILSKYMKTACVFVLGEPARADRSELGNTNSFLTTAQIKKLHAAGWEIGYHTNTHCDLRTLSDLELDTEIGTSKKALEKQLGFTMRYFAYPRGLYSKRIIDAVKRAGFEAAFTIEGARVAHEDTYMLSRLPLEGTFSFAQFQALISPIGQAVTKLFIYILEQKEALTLRVTKR